MTLPRKLRLSRTAFSRALQGPLRAETTHFSLTASSIQGGGCAAVISKKIAKRSVDRHLLKRRILELLRPHCSSKRSLIAYARKGSAALPFSLMKKEFEELVSRV